MDCHDLSGMWSISLLEFILKNLILLRNGCININKVIWLFEKSVGIDKWLKSCGDRYLIVVMNKVMI